MRSLRKQKGQKVKSAVSSGSNTAPCRWPDGNPAMQRTTVARGRIVRRVIEIKKSLFGLKPNWRLAEASCISQSGFSRCLAARLHADVTFVHDVGALEASNGSILQRIMPLGDLRLVPLPDSLPPPSEESYPTCMLSPSRSLS